MNRKEWKDMIQNKMKFLQSFDEHKGKKYEKKPGKLTSSRGAKKRKKIISDVFTKNLKGFFVRKRGYPVTKREHTGRSMKHLLLLATNVGRALNRKGNAKP